MIYLFVFDSMDDTDKFTCLYEKYKHLMYVKAESILCDEMLAEDAVSEAFVRVYKNMQKIGDVDSPETASFLMTIVRNRALTIYAKQKKEVPEEYLEDKVGADPFLTDEIAAADIDTDRVIEIVNKLGDEAKGIFLMKYAYDVSHKEIAAQFGITENLVTVKLHRIRKKLLAEFGGI